MNDRNLQMTVFHALDGLPAGASMNSVTAESVNVAGRHALRVGLTEAAASGVPGVDYVDQPTFVLIPADFGNGIVEVDLLSRLADTAPDYARMLGRSRVLPTESRRTWRASKLSMSGPSTVPR
jgi:hypothetical protein